MEYSRVTVCHTAKRLIFSLRATPFLLALVLVAGCTDEYPEAMKYPLRNDPLLASDITAVPNHWDRPGEFPLRMLNALRPGEERASAEKNFLNPRDIDAASDEQLESALEELFGTPANPIVGGIEPEVRARLRLDADTLAAGSVVYRSHCLHCHGLTGNGRGPTASWVNPHPRDYRQGLFKFTSTLGGNERKPRRDDLLRTVRQGIEGTSMPSFGLLPQSDQEAVVSYVIHLSLRGNVEFGVMQQLIQKSISSGEVKSTVSDYLTGFVGFWMKASEESSIITPDPKYPIPTGDQRRASVQRGFKLFNDTSEAGCIACHKDYGRQALLFYDKWGTIGRPLDVTQRVYRGGQRRIDLYWRIYSGVNGSNMPGFGNVLASESFRTQNQHDGIWDLVNFLEVLPFKQMRKEYDINID
jgi:mono/diheme cytochrome c family protein